MGARWQLQEAKNRFTEVVERAIKVGPQTVTKDGKDAVVIVSGEQYQRRTETAKRQTQSLAAFLLPSPLSGARLRVRRSRDAGRVSVRDRRPKPRADSRPDSRRLAAAHRCRGQRGGP